MIEALALAAVLYASGSDAPTPYTVTSAGIALPGGVVFEDNGHVNIKTTAGDKGIHFEALNNQPSGQWIGKDFLPWSAFGLDGDFCVSWVQISEFNEHFGEGGQEPVCTDPPPVVPEDPKPPLACEEGFVPGWLDEDGNAQGCVNNAPDPETENPPSTPSLPEPSEDTSVVPETSPTSPLPPLSPTEPSSPGLSPGESATSTPAPAAQEVPMLAETGPSQASKYLAFAALFIAVGGSLVLSRWLR